MYELNVNKKLQCARTAFTSDDLRAKSHTTCHVVAQRQFTISDKHTIRRHASICALAKINK